ncbi:hypothetical protein Tco_1361778 [Tanacetum coccineum]
MLTRDSEDEIEFVDNEMESYMASKPSRVGYVTKSLLGQWRETYVNDDYNPYDDDMYEGQDIPENIQSICDNLDIKSNLARQKKKFKEYAHYDTESLKNTILSYLNSIEKRIDERACHEEELRIKERNVKERRNDVKCPENDTDAKGAKISKNGSDDDITIAKSSHDKDKTKLQAKNKDLENIVCNMGKSTEPLRLLTNEQRAYWDNIRKSVLGYKDPCVLSKANAKILKVYSTYKLHDENVQLHVFDSEETFKDAEKSRLKMKEFQKDEKVQELLKDRLLEVTLAEDVKNLVINSCVEIKNKNLQDEIEQFSKESKDVSNESKTADTFCNDAFDVTQELSKRIVDLEKDLSKVETNQCDEVKVKVNFDEIETNKIELEHRVASLLKENEQLNSITDINIFELEKESRENICENAKCELQTKIVELEKVLTQQTKDFDDVKLELSKRTAKFEAYFEKLEKTKVFLERQLARKTDDSNAEKDQFLKEINHLRVQLENLKGKCVETKFDKPSILGKPPADKLLINPQISKSWFTPKVNVQNDLSKPVTAQYLPKNKKINF